MDKTKKVILGIIVIIIISIALIIMTPNLQTNSLLDSLNYVDYDNGWGFNPPEDWQTDNASNGVFLWPIEESMSDKVLLKILIGTTSSDINEIGQKQLDEFENDFWVNSTENFSIISHGKKTINDIDSYEVVYSYEPIYENGTIGPETKIKTNMLIKNNKAIQFTYQSLTSYYGKYESDINQSLNTLIII